MSDIGFARRDTARGVDRFTLDADVAIPVLLHAADADGSPVPVFMVDTFVVLDDYASDPGTADAWVPVSGNAWRLQSLTLIGSETGVYTIMDDDGDAPSPVLALPLLANTPFTLTLGNGVVSAAADNTLTIVGPALSTLSGTLIGQGGVAGA